MEEEFQGGVCGGNWWMNPSRNLFGSSPCSSAVNDFGWYNHGGATAVKTTSTDSAGSASASDGGGSVVLQGVQNPHQPTLQTTHDWNQDLLNDSGRSQENYSHFLNTLKQVNPSFPPLDQIVHQPNSLPTLPLSSDSYSYTSSLLQTMFDADSSQHHHQSLSTNYSSPPNYQMNSTMLIKPASLPKQQIVNNFQFANNTPFWNASAHVADSRHIRASFPTSTHPQLIPSPLTKPKLNPHTKHHYEKVGDTDSMAKKAGSEPAFKRARIETPSPLPTFKVRKEKLGDRVTALQQLVSPFGKTDTASVLHEAIEYIKLLHDQVTVLSTPYLKNGSPPLQPQQDEEATKDLRSRGLCLVPISSTFPVAAETTSDFWSPTFGGSFR